jgi:micrococcal nuclease
MDSRTRWPDGFDLARAVAKALAPPSAKVKIPSNAANDLVTKVADGDTIELRHLGHVRLVGIDAPTDEPRAVCYGREATNALRQLPAGTSVHYTVGSSREDAFHRNLAYLWLPSGTFVNERLVADGDATFLPQPHKAKLSDVERFYAKRMKRDGTPAAMAKRGLWGACSATED